MLKASCYQERLLVGYLHWISGSTHRVVGQSRCERGLLSHQVATASKHPRSEDFEIPPEINPSALGSQHTVYFTGDPWRPSLGWWWCNEEIWLIQTNQHSGQPVQLMLDPGDAQGNRKPLDGGATISHLPHSIHPLVGARTWQGSSLFVPNTSSRWGGVWHEGSPSISGEHSSCNPYDVSINLFSGNLLVGAQWRFRSTSRVRGPGQLGGRGGSLRGAEEQGNPISRPMVEPGPGRWKCPKTFWWSWNSGGYCDGSSYKPGSLFNPWDSGKARNWFQPGAGQPTSIPEVWTPQILVETLNDQVGLQFLLNDQVGLQEGAGWLPSAPPQPRLPPPVPRGPPVPMVKTLPHTHNCLTWKNSA